MSAKKKLTRNSPRLTETDALDTGVNDPQRSSMKDLITQTHQAAKDNRKDLAKESVKGGVEGAQLGASVGSIVPGVGTLVGTGLGAVAGAGMNQAKVGRESGDKGLAFITGTTIGGPVGGLMNASMTETATTKAAERKAHEAAQPKKNSGLDKVKAKRISRNNEQEARRKRTQRQGQHRHQSGVNRLETSLEKAEPASEKDLAQVGKAAAGAHLTRSETKSVGTLEDKLTEKGMAKGMEAGGKETGVGSAFAKGFAGGALHVGKHKFSEKRALSAPQGAGMVKTVDAARGFGYNTPAKNAQWSQMRAQSPTTSRDSARLAVEQHQVMAQSERDARTAVPEKKTPTYTPSIEIEQPTEAGFGMER